MPIHQAMYRFLDVLPQGVLLAEHQGRILGVNRPFCLLFNLGEPATLVGQEVDELYRRMGSALTEPEPFISLIQHAEEAHQSIKDGQVDLIDGRILSYNFLPVQLDGDRLGRVWSFQDVTDQHKAKSSLRDVAISLSTAPQIGRASQTETADLAKAVSAIAAGDLQQEVPTSPDGELATLAMAISTMAEELRERTRERDESRSRVLQAQTAVRRQVAEQLHGSIQSKLLVLDFKLGRVESMMEHDPKRATADLHLVRNQLEELREKEIRMMSYRLHPAIVRMGLAPAIRFLRDQFEGPFAINLALDPDLQKLVTTGRPDREALILSLFLTVEDLLTNCVKHATCSTVDISAGLTPSALARTEGTDQTFELEVTVQDNGVGFDPNQVAEGLGMTNIRDRIALHDGRFEVFSQVGAGARFVVTVPYP